MAIDAIRANVISFMTILRMSIILGYSKMNGRSRCQQFCLNIRQRNYK